MFLGNPDNRAGWVSLAGLYKKTHLGQLLFQQSIVSTMLILEGVIIGFVLTIVLGRCLLSEIVQTIVLGDFL